VSGKTQDFDEMVRRDLYYICNWSIWLDVEILFRAIPYVIFGKNR
jgi:lipopolysaccharide/colanic/teichoic acid biosynthesis glycosyltransferase